VPTPPSVPEVIRFRLTGTLQNGNAWGIRHYVLYTGSAPSGPTMLTLCEGVASAFNTHVLAILSEDTALTAVDGIDLSSDLGSGATADVDYAGAIADPAVADQICAVVRFEIDRRYRGGKPKTFIPGESTTSVGSNSTWGSGFVNDMGTAYGDFQAAIGDLSAAGCDLEGIVNVSLYQGFTPVHNPVTGRYKNVPTYRATPLIDLVSSFTCDVLFGSQKRRRLA